MTVKKAFFMASPPTWVASVTPAVFGIVYCAWKRMGLTWKQGILLLLACILLQSAVNVLNDYYDFIKGTDSENDYVEENDSVLVYGNVKPESAKRLGIGYLVCGLICGGLASIGSGLTPIVIGLVGAIIIVFYSGGALPISYLPIGEIVSGFVMGGLIPLGIAACADGRVHGELFFYALPLMFGIALIMASNNCSDIEKDEKTGRKTFPVCAGRERARGVYQIAICLWVLFVLCVPCLIFGRSGLLSVLGIFLFAKMMIKEQITNPLLPEGRVKTMKRIAGMNAMLNGIYILTFAVHLMQIRD